MKEKRSKPAKSCYRDYRIVEEASDDGTSFSLYHGRAYIAGEFSTMHEARRYAIADAVDMDVTPNFILEWLDGKNTED